jgi:hypothetical protein
MRTSGEFISPKWLRIFQVIVGLVCIGISITIMASVVFVHTSKVGLYSLIFLASTGFIILGVERIVIGVKSTSLKRRSRLISIGIGVGIVVYFGSGYFFPEFISKLYVLILGLGLLATGALRIIDGIRNTAYERPPKAFTLGTGALCIAGALLVFTVPVIGLILLALIISIIFLINGIQIAFVGIFGKRMSRLRS